MPSIDIAGRDMSPNRTYPSETIPMAIPAVYSEAAPLDQRPDNAGISQAAAVTVIQNVKTLSPALRAVAASAKFLLAREPIMLLATTPTMTRPPHRGAWYQGLSLAKSDAMSLMAYSAM